MNNHDVSIGEMLDADDEEAIGLFGREPELQFVRLAAAFNDKKEAITKAIDALCDGRAAAARVTDALQILRGANNYSKQQALPVSPFTDELPRARGRGHHAARGRLTQGGQMGNTRIVPYSQKPLKGVNTVDQARARPSPGTRVGGTIQEDGR